MTALLVHQHGIFEPAVRDYAKALRTLLVYPPHLESLDEPLWKRLMSVIWAGALGDNISQDDQWQDESYDQLEGQDDDGDEDMAGTKDKEDKPSMERCLSSAAGGGGRGKGVTQIQSELLLLFPILLSSPSAPLLPAFPTKDSPRSPPTSLGSMLILKIVRFLDLHPAETSAHLSVMRGCNIVLAEMELNSRQEFVDAGTRLLPHLQGLWLARSKPLREQVIIAFKRLHPFITHYCVAQATRDMVLEQYARVVEGLRKEVCLRWGIAPLDMGTLLCDRSGSRTDQKHDDIFTICGIRVSHPPSCARMKSVRSMWLADHEQ
jgi:ataxia telangiectasia mutated family protein